jgi:hypothetical protein
LGKWDDIKKAAAIPRDKRRDEDRILTLRARAAKISKDDHSLTQDKGSREKTATKPRRTSL